LSGEARKCSLATDAGLTPNRDELLASLEQLPDDRLFTVAEVASLLHIRKADVYTACDQGALPYVRFECAVQIEGRDLKRWVALGLRQS
jgi:hypothetical protein